MDFDDGTRVANFLENLNHFKELNKASFGVLQEALMRKLEKRVLRVLYEAVKTACF